MISVRELLLAAVLPAIVAAAIVALGRDGRRAVLSALATFAAYMTAHLALFGWPSFPPAPARHGVAWAALAALACGVLVANQRTAIRWLWRCACIVISMALVGWRRFTLDRPWTAAEALWLGLMFLGSIVLWAGLERAARDQSADSRWTRAGAWLVAAASTGTSAIIVVIVGAAMGEGQALGGLALALLAAGALSLTSRGSVMGPGAVSVTAIAASMLWLSAVMWAELPPWIAVGMCAAPFAALLAELRPFRGLNAPLRTIIRAAVVALAGAAIGGPSALRELTAHADEYGVGD